MEFFDTNVLVYAIDRGETRKGLTAVALIRDALRAQTMVISTQVMLEFYAVVLRRNLAPREIAVDLLHHWADGAVGSTTPDTLWRAFDAQERFGFSLWDGTIVQAALDAKCDVLYTEDLQHEQQIGSLKVVNPFRNALEVHEPAVPYVMRNTRVAAKETRKRR